MYGEYVDKELGEYAVEYVAECAGAAELSVEVSTGGRQSTGIGD